MHYVQRLAKISCGLGNGVFVHVAELKLGVSDFFANIPVAITLVFVDAGIFPTPLTKGIVLTVVISST